MLLRMTVKLWKKYYLIHKKHVEEHEQIGELNYESSKEDEELPSPKHHDKCESPTHKRHKEHQQTPGEEADFKSCYSSGKNVVSDKNVVLMH